MENNNILNDTLFEAFASSSDNVYIYVSDLKNGMSRWSKNAVEYFDFPAEYMEDVLPSLKEKIHPEDQEGYFDEIGQVLTGKRDRHSYQYRLKNRYGSYVWIECKGSVIRENGEPVIFAGLMTRLDNQNKYDSVTGLSTIFDFYNYNFEGKTGYLLLVGIDQFRKVVSNYGYQFGDRVLVEFSKRLRTLCEPDARLYRMNGDEFLIIAENTDEATLFEFFECIKGFAEEIELEDGPKAKCYKKDFLLNEQGCNIDLCGYPHEEEEVLDPIDTIRNYQEKRATLNAEIDKVLAEIEALLPGGVEK